MRMGSETGHTHPEPVWVLTYAITSGPRTLSSTVSMLISEAVLGRSIEHACLPRVALGMSHVLRVHVLGWSSSVLSLLSPESCNQSAPLSGSRVLLWGPAAVEHHKTCRSLGKSLWQQPSVGDILRLLDPDRMMQTILHFPQYRRLLHTEVGCAFLPSSLPFQPLQRYRLDAQCPSLKPGHTSHTVSFITSTSLKQLSKIPLLCRTALLYEL